MAEKSYALGGEKAGLKLRFKIMLPKTRRVTKDFIGKIIKNGRSFHSNHLTLKFLTSPSNALFGFVVPLKVGRNAVGRNLLKRRGRHIIKKHLSQIKTNQAYVMMFKLGSLDISFKDLELEILSLFKKAQSLND